MTDDATTLGGIRRMLLAILLLGMSGTAIELLLLDHNEDTTQLIPLVLIAAGTIAVFWNALRRGRGSVLAVQIVMVLFVAAGLLGVYFHFTANVAFQREVDPALSGSSLLWTVLQAKAPPALAPGTMVQLGLIGLAYAYRQPAVPLRNSLEENRYDS
ncbi:MAG: hypothetical protein ABIP65_08645 [Vicinamibacterales bacterium]